MSGSIKIFYYMDDIDTAIPLRSQIALMAFNKGIPASLCTLIAGMTEIQAFMNFLEQLAVMKAIIDDGEESGGSFATSQDEDSLRGRFIEHLQSISSR